MRPHGRNQIHRVDRGCGNETPSTAPVLGRLLFGVRLETLDTAIVPYQKRIELIAREPKATANANGR